MLAIILVFYFITTISCNCAIQDCSLCNMNEACGWCETDEFLGACNPVELKANCLSQPGGVWGSCPGQSQQPDGQQNTGSTNPVETSPMQQTAEDGGGGSTTPQADSSPTAAPLTNAPSPDGNNNGGTIYNSNCPSMEWGNVKKRIAGTASEWNCGFTNSDAKDTDCAVAERACIPNQQTAGQCDSTVWVNCKGREEQCQLTDATCGVIYLVENPTGGSSVSSASHSTRMTMLSLVFAVLLINV